jgi:hypothetical protein
MTLKQVKSQVKTLLNQNNLNDTFEFALKDKRVLSALISMSYDKATLTSWRAAYMAGRIIGILARHDNDEARGHIRRIFWNTSDESGTICWSAPEILGEAVRENPAPFEDVVHLIIGLTEEDSPDNIFRAGGLHAIGRIGEVHREYIEQDAINLVIEYLENNIIDVSANAIIAAGRLKLKIDKDVLNRLKVRTDKAVIYNHDMLITYKFKELFDEFVSK